MALPIIGLYFLLGLIIVLFFVGISRFNVNASLGFIVLASVIMITTGMFVMNEGIQLQNVDNFVDGADSITVNYQTVSYDVNSWNWLRVVTDIIFWGGFIGIIFGFAYNFQRSKGRQVSEWDMVS